MDDIRYFLEIDRSHPTADGDSDLEDVTFDNMAQTPTGCIPADANDNRNYGRFRYTQFVRVLSTVAAEINVPAFGGPTIDHPGLAPQEFATNGSTCLGTVSIPFTVMGECSALGPLDMVLVDTLLIELDTFAVDSNGDGGIDDAEFSLDEERNDAITLHPDGSYVFAADLPFIPSGLGDSVMHALRITSINSCGEQTSQIVSFWVVDRYVEGPVCINGLVFTLLPVDGECIAIVNADELIGAAVYDCSGQGPEVDPVTGLPIINQYAVYQAEEVEADPNFIPDSTHSSITITEDDVA